MTPAEKRIKEQIDRWLTSLDLHLQYADLNDLAYNRVQNWPVHDRPNKLVVDLAKQKALELSEVLTARRNAGDTQFAEAMELIAFLVNLVGSQHVQRFIPLAEPPQQAPAPIQTPPAAPITKPAAPVAQPVTPPRLAPSPVIAASPTVAKPAPTPVPTPPPKPTLAPPAKSAAVPELAEAYVPQAKSNQSKLDDTGTTREMPRPQRNPAASHKRPATAKPANKPTASDNHLANNSTTNVVLNIEQLIIIDAVRLTNWGRKWHELAESIARIADRPSVGEIRRILRAHRDEIQRRAAEPQN